MKKHKVTLTELEVELLEEITKKGKHSAMIICNAHILLNNNQNPGDKKQDDEGIASFLGITVRTVKKIWEKFQRIKVLLVFGILIHAIRCWEWVKVLLLV